MAVLSAGNSPLELAAATDAGVGFNVELIIHAQYLLAAKALIATRMLNTWVLD